MFTMPGTWYLPLRGTPCASCGQPAARLIVFAVERVIAHEDDEAPPCHLSNPRPSGLDELMLREEPRRAA
jgi:hypothetical protein